MAKQREYLGAIVVLLLAPVAAISDQSKGVPGWAISGSAAQKYQVSVDAAVANSGLASARLTSITDVEGFEFGTLMQSVDARPHVGKRMQFLALIRISGVATGAALWMRIDDNDGKVVAFDNMSNRGLYRGNMSWSPASIILDVPPNSKRISFGVLLKGEGMVWIDDATLESVFKHMPTTGSPVSLPNLTVAPDDLSLEPENLDFEL